VDGVAQAYKTSSRSPKQIVIENSG